MKNSSIIRDQLQETLTELNSLKNKRPFKGWIRAIRQGLAMSGKQLAGRIDVDVSRVAEMEKAETQGNITLKSLRRAAEAMECELVYALVPKTTLEDTLRVQAEKKAKQHMQIVAHTMRLEDQGLSQESDAKQVVKMVNEWLNDPPRWLWDSK